jgi:hypothetical protein
VRELAWAYADDLQRAPPPEPPLPPTKPYGVIIDRRPDALAGREVPNHDEVVTALRASSTTGHLAWVSFVGTKASVADAVRLFRGASVIIGPHGAGFFHLCWCRPGTPVVEMGYSGDLDRNSGHPLPSTYYGVAIALGLPYSLVIGAGDLFGSITPSPADVVATVGAALARSAAEAAAAVA